MSGCQKSYRVLTAPRGLGCLFYASSGNPLPDRYVVRLLSWGSFPFGVLVMGLTYPAVSEPQLRHPFRVSHPLRALLPLYRRGSVSHHNAHGIFPFSVFPLRGYVSRYRVRYPPDVASLLASSLRRKKPTRSLDSRVLIPAQDRTFQTHRSG